MANNNEQWKLSGNCELCRRKNYCKTRCSKSKKYEQKELYSITANMLFKRLMKKYRED